MDNIEQWLWGFNRESDSVTVGAKSYFGCAVIIGVSIAKAIPSLLELEGRAFVSRTEVFQSRKRFRHCWSALGAALGGRWEDVSIAKAIPSLLEPSSTATACHPRSCFNRESDSVTVGAVISVYHYWKALGFNRESDSVTVGAAGAGALQVIEFVSIAKAIPSLLEHALACRLSVDLAFQSRKRFRHCWSARSCPFYPLSIPVSIAKAIPSLLERQTADTSPAIMRSFNRESDSVTVGAQRQRKKSARRSVFQSRKRFRHCWSDGNTVSAQSGDLFQSRKRFRHCWSPCSLCRGFTWL